MANSSESKANTGSKLALCQCVCLCMCVTVVHSPTHLLTCVHTHKYMFIIILVHFKLTLVCSTFSTHFICISIHRQTIHYTIKEKQPRTAKYNLARMDFKLQFGIVKEQGKLPFDKLKHLLFIHIHQQFFMTTRRKKENPTYYEILSQGSFFHYLSHSLYVFYETKLPFMEIIFPLQLSLLPRSQELGNNKIHIEFLLNNYF